jgi:hypothetical protein
VGGKMTFENEKFGENWRILVGQFAFKENRDIEGEIAVLKDNLKK